ncbi:MAG: ion transporter [Deferribacterales bacterium]
MTFKEKLYEIIFEAETKEGKLFDEVLLLLIILSVITLSLESIDTFHVKFKNIFLILEVFFTVIFTIEYLLRIYCIKKPLKYMTSFFGIIDLLSFLPSYLEIFFPGIHYIISIRVLRLLRIFRILKMYRFSTHAKILYLAIKMSRYKIAVFLFAVLNIVIVIGTIMYMIEGPDNGFDNIPKSIYWAIVTLTTVGYGDISPKTPLGQLIASLLMITGYGIIAVPTGIMTYEINKIQSKELTVEACPACGRDGHDKDAIYCKFCGEKLN